jgi:hypothetical protein
MDKKREFNDAVEVLMAKGYKGYFTSQYEPAGKLKDIVEEHLKQGSNGGLSLKDDLRLTTYLKWNGEDTPNMRCSFTLSLHDAGVSLKRLTAERSNEYGVLMKKYELTNVPITSVPTLDQLCTILQEGPDLRRTNGQRM